jgi:DNA-binding IclR family transcriptional regulator
MIKNSFHLTLPFPSATVGPDMRAAIGGNPKIPEVEAPKETQHFRQPAVDRAMNLFELLASSRGGLTLSELSRKLNLPKSTTHYLIYTLETRGYLQRTAEGRHELGLRFAKLTAASTAEQDFARLAKPYLRQIAVKLNLTAALTALRGAEAVVIAIAAAAQSGGGGAWVGRHIDLHCTAQGKALIAFLSDDELGEIFGGREFAPFTSKTILSLSALKVHLAEVRACGFSVNDEEYFQGVRAAAAPIRDPLGVVVAAVSVRGSSKHIPSSRLPELGQEMVCASRDLAMELARH